MKTLRHLSLLIFLCCAFSSGKAQYVTIPDSNFVSWLQFYYPTCMNGNQMDTTCADIISADSIDLGNYFLSDLTGIQYFDNLNTLLVQSSSLSFIPAFPQNLTFLYISYTALTALPALPTNLITLNVNHNALTYLPALPSTLQNLNCSENRSLAVLPALPSGLQSLNCSSDSLSALPALPDSLIFLKCAGNLLTVLPALPAPLRQLDCSGNLFTSLSGFNLSLVGLSCGNAQLNSLSALPDSLLYFYFSNSGLSALPPLPASLQILDVTSVSLTALPALPNNLGSLSIVATPISVLPTLPQSLININIDNSPITSLPALPDSLYELTVYQNQLTSLPALPRFLKSLNCSNNQLTSLPALPDSIQLVICNNNPNLHCLPKLTRIGNLQFMGCPISCLPNYGSVGVSYPPLNTIPLCDPLNANNCAVYWNISGNVYYDSSSNCIQNNGDANMAQLKVNLLQNGDVVQQVYTSQYGVYAFETTGGNYIVTVDTTGIPFNVICPANGFHSVVITANDSTAGGSNFAMQCKTGFDVGVHTITIAQRTRPAAFNTVRVRAMDMAAIWEQTCNTSNLSGQLAVSFSGPATYISPAPNALIPVVNGNTLTYAVNDWSAVADSNFAFIIQVDTTAPLGQLVCFEATVAPIVGDNNPTNNHVNYCVPVLNSFDPNDKSVYPVSNVDITGDKWLTYMVRFQNTGNAPAEHIYITDTLDTHVNIETFQVLAYSFAPQVTIKGNAVRFNFANINLADSLHDEPNSHGYVQYKVKVKDNATVGTVINNTAFIYFDFNAPVVTNTTTNTLALPNSINAIANSNVTMQLYPNPAQDIVMINLSDNLTGGTLMLSDVTGRGLATIQLTASHNQLNTASLSSGVYLVTAEKGGVRVVQRLVVSR